MTPIINFVFYGSVDALVWLAKLFGITYQEINVLIFCIGWPLVTVIMMATIVKLWRKNQVLSRRMAKGWFAH
jgi:branched-subunit amino acid transport protein AzlD